MTRREIVKLLEALMGAYPMTKIPDPKMTADAWEMAFGSYEAELVYKAARVYMITGRFFPTISDIHRCMSRTGMFDAADNLLPAPAEHESGCTVCPYEDDCDKDRCLFE